MSDIDNNCGTAIDLVDDVHLWQRLPPPMRVIGHRIVRALRRIDARMDRAADLFRETPSVTVVDTVEDLPEHAGPREWFRVSEGTVAERASVYLGNGPVAPLSKITPTPL